MWTAALGQDIQPALTRRRRTKPTDRGKRRDVQGLRAVAVLAVVINHLFGHPQGGFLGVDVFFVISGYLITSLLLREGNGRGTISLVAFYKRRIRRLFPAALTVIVLTVGTAHLVFLSGRARSTTTDGIWAALFGANWREISIGTNYFSSFGPVSPLQHYWSLSVEEQFYAVWPMVLLIAFLICRRLFDGRRHAVIATGAIGALLLTVPSLIYAWYESDLNKVVSYFSTFSRAWELGLGATLAVLQPYMRGNRPVLTALSWLGLALIGVSLFTVTQSHVPFPGAILPCVGCGLCLVAATTTATAANPLLTNPVSNYIGDISYSVYLVHFPVIIFAAALVPHHSDAYDVAVALFILGVAALLYHCIENPIRESNWLRPGASRTREDRPPYWSWGQALGSSATLVAVAVYTLVVQSAPDNSNANLVIQQQLAAAESASSASSSGGSTPVTGEYPVGPAVAAVQADLKAAVLTKSWPDLVPPFDQPAPENNNGCQAEGPLLPIPTCTWGSTSAHQTMVLVGDSTSGAFTNTFDHFIDQVPDWKMVVRNTTECPFSDSGFIESDTAAHSVGCADRNAAILAELQQTKPDMVVLTTNQGRTDVTASVGKQLAKLEGYVKTIVVLPAPPKIDNPLQCDTAFSKPPDCVTKQPPAYDVGLDNERAMAASVHATFLDPTKLYCVDRLCPLFVKNIPLTKDGAHLTPTYAIYLAPAVYELFREAKLLP